MKLILAIVNNDDSTAVSTGLTQAGIFATKLATTGGFLKSGNTTFLIGVDDLAINSTIEIIAKYSSKHSQSLPQVPVYGEEMSFSMPLEVTVGGATVFVLNIERFEKL